MCIFPLLTNIKSRLAVNSVTIGDYDRPLQISQFIKDLFSGFQLLNLKNDILRKRSDGIKYSVSYLARRKKEKHVLNPSRSKRSKTSCTIFPCGI